MVSFLAVVYAYAIYPLALWLISHGFGKTSVAPESPPSEEWPRLSLLLVAHNEATVLADRLLNALEVDYPADRYEVVVGSDGSTDETAEIARSFKARGVQLIEFAQQRGKAAVLNEVIPNLAGEVILLSDANTQIERNAAKHLARWFSRPEIFSVCGRLVLTDPLTGKNSDGLYWKYETYLKRLESRLGAILGANGAIYALRRSCYVPIPNGTIIDDFVIPLLVRLRFGGRIEYDTDAVACEETASDVAAEFRRRCRIGAGGFQAMGLLWRLLDPRRGWISLSFFSHKLLRWLCPFFLLIMVATNVLLLGDPVWRWVLAFQVGFYGSSLAIPPMSTGPLKRLRLATMFTSMNVALLVGFWNWATGKQAGVWEPTQRSASMVESGR